MSQSDVNAKFTTKDSGAKIWRYMDLWKFYAMLKNQSLYFCRADKLGDKFEGSLPKKNIEEEIRNLERGFAEDGSDLVDTGRIENLKEKLRTDASLRNQAHRKHVFVNCWCRSCCESAAMWNLYIENKQGVAITSTIQKLKDNLNHDRSKKIYIGDVQYIDYSEDKIPDFLFVQIHRFIHKMKSFSHENELRLLFGPKHSHEVSQEENPCLGEYISIRDLNKLIDEVFIHPEAPRHFEEIVQTLVDKHGLNKKVQRTDLSETPLF